MPSNEQPSGSPSISALRGSPRSSVDSGLGGGGGGHSPFLHSLQQRFRKSSSASTHSNIDQAAAAPVLDLKSRSDASKEAKKFLLAVVKDTWEYPSIGAEWPQQREPVSYRRREDGLSDAESDNPTHHKRRSRNSDPYKFENPDAVADFVAQRRAKRRRLMEEEMTWNVGLLNWSGQRDAWTGAVKYLPQNTESVSAAAATADGLGKPHLTSTLHERDASESTTDDSSNWPLSAHSPTPENSSSIDSVDIQQLVATTPAPNAALFHFNIDPPPTNSSPQPQLQAQPQPQAAAQPHHTTQHQHRPSTTTTTTTTDDTNPEPYLPIYPPLFPPTHRLRSRLTPPAYPTIYSKIVLQSLTPNIPIPLTHMTRALVQGWKTEGAWPAHSTINPAGQAGTAADRRRIKEKGREKEGAFSRWRREHRSRNLGLPKEITTSTTQRQRKSWDGGGAGGKSSGRGGGTSSVDGLTSTLPDDVGIAITDRPAALLSQGQPQGQSQGRVRKSISVVKRVLGVSDHDHSHTQTHSSDFDVGAAVGGGAGGTGQGTVGAGNRQSVDIGIDFEEQEKQEWEREEQSLERDRMLNQRLLD